MGVLEVFMVVVPTSLTVGVSTLLEVILLLSVVSVMVLFGVLVSVEIGNGEMLVFNRLV